MMDNTPEDIARAISNDAVRTLTGNATARELALTTALAWAVARLNGSSQVITDYDKQMLESSKALLNTALGVQKK